MSIASWFTIVGFFIAIFGFLVKEELKIFLLKIGKEEKILAVFILFVGLPFLLFYKSISERISVFNYPPFVWNWGFEPENIAFALFFLVFLYMFIRISLWIPKKSINTSIISTYIEILENSPSSFWQVFLKFEDNATIENNWKSYEDLVFHHAFIESSFTYRAAKKKVEQIPKIKEFNSKKIIYYEQLLNKNHFEKLFRFYLEFEDVENVNSNWPQYRRIFLNNNFLVQAVEQNPKILLDIWHNIDNEQDFSQIILSFLTNRNSLYITKKLKNIGIVLNFLRICRF
jgi:hypothetical protein